MNAPAAVDESLWLRQLQKRKDGSIPGTETNIFEALRTCPRLAGMLRYNNFDDSIEFVYGPPWSSMETTIGAKWSDFHRIHLQMWLQKQEFTAVRSASVQDAVIAVAMTDKYNPVQDRIKAIAWDETKRLDDWLSVYLGCDGDAGYLRAVGRAFLIGAIARLFSPGCKVDNVLVLEGPQGVGKSTVVRILSLGYTTDAMPDMHSKDAALQIQGTWINELPELAAMTRSEIEPIKAFLARQVDRYRPPYGRNAIERPRGCVFVATTNLHEYLNDETGGRRFWPVRCRSINRELLQADVEQLWAEAFWAWIDKEQWHLDGVSIPLATTEQELRRFQPEHELALLEYLDGVLAEGRSSVDMRELLRFPGGIEDIAKQGQQAGGLARQFSKVLSTIGWEKCKPTGRGSKRRQPYVYRLPLPSKPKPEPSQAVISMDDDDIPF